MEEKQMISGADATEKLYYQDSHAKEFAAQVLSCEKVKKGYRIVLDRTAFFPEGGGQFGDIGWLYETGEAAHAGEAVCEAERGKSDEAACAGECGKAGKTAHDTAENRVVISDTQEKDGVIYHMADRPLPVGAFVHGVLDFEERFIRMQQHTGEHILSGVVHRLYGYDNVGFHLGADVTTLDFNGELTPEQVQKVEELSNRAVFDNIPVQILYPTKEELKSLDYRSKIDIEGQVRIVSIPGIDICACCAPHMNTTGEIGLIKILACDHHRGGCRMTMVSGMRALRDYQRKQKSVTEISVLLSAKPDAVGEAVQHQKEQTQKLREQLNQHQASYLEQRLQEITGEEKNVTIFVEDFDNIAVRNFVNAAVLRCSGVCGAFVGTDEGGYRYILGSGSADVRETAKKLNAAFAGKGGGKPEMVQGSLTGTQEEIRRVLEAEAETL